MALVKESQNLPLSIEIKTLKGAPAKVDGIPAWTSTDETIGKVEVSADGLSATFKPVAIGACSVIVEVDADLGEGKKPLMGSLDLQVVGDDAAIVTVTAGTPVDV